MPFSFLDFIKALWANENSLGWLVGLFFDWQCSLLTVLYFQNHESCSLPKMATWMHEQQKIQQVGIYPNTRQNYLSYQIYGSTPLLLANY